MFKPLEPKQITAPAETHKTPATIPVETLQTLVRLDSKSQTLDKLRLLQKVEQAVSQNLDAAYREVAAKKEGKPEEVYYSRWCEPTSEILNQKLNAAGLKSRTLFYPGDWTITEHHFILVSDPKGEVIIDPTWQQFKKQPDEKQPKALIILAEPQKIAETLEKYGIPKSQHKIWLHPLSQAKQK